MVLWDLDSVCVGWCEWVSECVSTWNLCLTYSFWRKWVWWVALRASVVGGDWWSLLLFFLFKVKSFRPVRLITKPFSSARFAAANDELDWLQPRNAMKYKEWKRDIAIERERESEKRQKREKKKPKMPMKKEVHLKAIRILTHLTLYI